MRIARNFAGIGVLACPCFLAACGSPVPPAAQAGVSIHVQEYDPKDPVHAHDNCPPSRHWVNVPYARGKDTNTQPQQTTNSDTGPIAVNSQDGNVVKCTVKAKGSNFDVTLEASGYAVNAAMMPINPSHVHIRIPTIGPSDGSATGTMSIQDDASLVTYESTQCSFSVQGGQMGVDVGKIWASSQCEYLSDLKTPGSNCQVDTGFFVFENCAN